MESPPVRSLPSHSKRGSGSSCAGCASSLSDQQCEGAIRYADEVHMGEHFLGKEEAVGSIPTVSSEACW